VEKSPDLLADRTETVVIDLVKIENPDEVLNEALAKYLGGRYEQDLLSGLLKPQ
jgi:hypothetical protein